MMRFISSSIFLFMVMTVFSCQGDRQALNNIIPLSGQWKLVTVDSKECALPEYNDSPSSEISLPGDWPLRKGGNNDMAGTVWLRKKIIIPEELAEKLLVISFGKIALADETYFNGIQVGGEGYIPKDDSIDDYGFSWQKKRKYVIPRSLVKPGKENTIAIRVFSHIITGIAGPMELMELAVWNSVYSIEEVFPAVMNISSFILNVILIVLFIITLEWDTRIREIIYSSSLLIIVSAVHLLVLGFTPVDGLVRFKLLMGLTVAGHFLFLMAVQEFMNFRNRPASISSFVLLLVVSASIVFSPNSAFLIMYCGYLSLVIIILYIIYYTGVFIIALYRDPMRYWPFILAAVPLILSSAHISYYIVTGRVYDMPLSIALHLPIALMAVMLVFILDFRNIRSENNSLARNLLRRTQQLNQLKKKVLKDGAKPEPREMVHELVEYLDGNYMEFYDRIALAKKFGLNEDYMMQIFKKTTGVTISQYINARRIEAAQQLLRDTDSKIIDIGYHVGFDNLTHFHRLFKKQSGQTPREFREMSKE